MNSHAANDNEAAHPTYEFVFLDPEARGSPLARAKRLLSGIAIAAVSFVLWILILSPIIQYSF